MTQQLFLPIWLQFYSKTVDFEFCRFSGVEVIVFTFWSLREHGARKTSKIGHFQRIEISPFQLDPLVALVSQGLEWPHLHENLANERG